MPDGQRFCNSIFGNCLVRGVFTAHDKGNAGRIAFDGVFAGNAKGVSLVRDQLP